MERDSSAFIKPATTAHSPNAMREVDFIRRFEMTGMPFTLVPCNTLNSASISSVTSLSSCTEGVIFRVRPRSSKLKEGGGV